MEGLWWRVQSGGFEVENGEICGKKFVALVMYANLTECINQIVFERQLPHKTVNLWFRLAMSKTLTTVWGN